MPHQVNDFKRFLAYSMAAGREYAAVSLEHGRAQSAKAWELAEPKVAALRPVYEEKVKPVVDKVVEASTPVYENHIKPFYDNKAKPFYDDKVKPFYDAKVKPHLDKALVVGQDHLHRGLALATKTHEEQRIKLVVLLQTHPELSPHTAAHAENIVTFGSWFLVATALYLFSGWILALILLPFRIIWSIIKYPFTSSSRSSSKSSAGKHKKKKILPAKKVGQPHTHEAPTGNGKTNLTPRKG